MNNQRLSKFDEKYIKNHYITDYIIDDKNKKVRVQYINGEFCYFPLTSKTLSKIKYNMRQQYYEWSELIKKIYILNPIKLIYISMHLKKQKYYIEHENELYNCNIKSDVLKKALTKKEVDVLRKEKKNTHSYFNLSSVKNYKLRTMKRVYRVIEEKH